MYQTIQNQSWQFFWAVFSSRKHCGFQAQILGDYLGWQSANVNTHAIRFEDGLASKLVGIEIGTEIGTDTRSQVRGINIFVWLCLVPQEEKINSNNFLVCFCTSSIIFNCNSYMIDHIITQRLPVFRPWPWDTFHSNCLKHLHLNCIVIFEHISTFYLQWFHYDIFVALKVPIVLLGDS